eukprot:CAMPEP_0179067356 /NCGR_PEP_ID=MMETSP0796-20121207/29446_1 /TAXON_ID=73915 /ORGANISM="Pyrodinium bahamense, Strain pbaha01" /LENGTH=406 /DNA_ID=CAMNT_0020764381 /DNA_START=139 /DNA_END=1362 /DNA_ORIENTATION=+
MGPTGEAVSPPADGTTSGHVFASFLQLTWPRPRPFGALAAPLRPRRLPPSLRALASAPPWHAGACAAALAASARAAAAAPRRLRRPLLRGNGWGSTPSTVSVAAAGVLAGPGACGSPPPPRASASPRPPFRRWPSLPREPLEASEALAEQAVPLQAQLPAKQALRRSLVCLSRERDACPACNAAEDVIVSHLLQVLVVCADTLDGEREPPLLRLDARDAEIRENLFTAKEVPRNATAVAPPQQPKPSGADIHEEPDGGGAGDPSLQYRADLQLTHLDPRFGRRPVLTRRRPWPPFRVGGKEAAAQEALGERARRQALQSASTPEGTVATQSRPSECGRAKRQHSRYSEMLRGMIRRACERRKPREGPGCLELPLLPPDALDRERAPRSGSHCASTAGSEAQRRVVG